MRTLIAFWFAFVCGSHAATTFASDDWVVTYVEDFHTSDGFTPHASLSIANGVLSWSVDRTQPEDQYISKQVPITVGDIRITVIGRVDAWSGNADCRVGLGGSVGTGLSVAFGAYGAGCASQGPVVTAHGVDLNFVEMSCDFIGPWPWITPLAFYSATLEVSSNVATLYVPGVALASGTRTDHGSYNTLWIGRNVDGQFGSASGIIDQVIVETRIGSGYPTSASPIRVLGAGGQLGQNSPNPFNPSTTIPIHIEKSGHVEVDVYSVS